MVNMSKRNKQQKDSELFVFIGFIGIAISIIGMWAILIIKGC